MAGLEKKRRRLPAIDGELPHPADSDLLFPLSGSREDIERADNHDELM